MDGQRFHRLAQQISVSATRRRVLGGLLGGVAGGAYFVHVHEASAAAPCPRPLRKCGNRCYNPEGECCEHCRGGGVQVRSGVTTCRDYVCIQV